MLNSYSKLINLVIVISAMVGLSFFVTRHVSASSFTYPEYNVDIKVNSDTTVDVTEELKYRFNGEFSGVIRQITLNNPTRDLRCRNSVDVYCGGFERIALMGVYDQSGRKLDTDEYELFIQTNEDTGMSYYSIKWVVWPGGRSHNDYDFSWSIKYRVYGALAWVKDSVSATTSSPYFYWNVLPETRGGEVQSTNIRITLPQGNTSSGDILSIYEDILGYNNYDRLDHLGNQTFISMSDIGSFGNFTVAYRLDPSTVDQVSHLSFGSWIPMFGTELKIDGVDMGDIGGSLLNFPPGQHELQFSRDGYQSKVVQLDAKPGQPISLDSGLTPDTFALIGIILSLLLNLLGLILIPIGLFWAYASWKSKGRDKNFAKSIYPIFNPPDGVEPYMLGSLKDESVDREDVTGTIIDLAYRGHIKITEIEQRKNYKLTRLESAKRLSKIEEQLLDSLFGSKTEIETKTAGQRFASRYPSLVSKIYSEMVTRGYFTQRPDVTRQKHFGIGIGLLVLGILLGIGLTILWIEVVGIIGPVFLGFAVSATGIAKLALASAMPAKTSLGSKVFAEILGFKMYLERAEKYRLQDLTPEEFEKYLSYAIVFKIEKSWAAKFADIYKGPPDWYETSRSDIIWDAYWLSSFSRSFSQSMNTTVYQTLPKGTGSGAGSGWSGGGSFGGFSGGGGGGGISGAF